MKAETQKRVAVIGAGISGLLTAYFLKKRPDVQIEIFESSERAGGWIRSERSDTTLREWGPHSILADSSWSDLFEELNLQPQDLKPQARKRFIYKDAKLHALKPSPLTVLTTKLLSWSTKFRLLRSLFYYSNQKLQDDLSVYDFFARFLGEDFAKYLMDAFIKGVYAGDSKKLSAEACFPTLVDAARVSSSLISMIRRMKKNRSSSGRSKILSFKEGLSQLTDALCDKLRNNIHLNEAVLKIEFQQRKWFLKFSNQTFEFDSVIVATPARQASALLSGFIPTESAEFLNQIPYQEVAVSSILWSKPENFESGFGFLVPQSESLPMLGSLWPSEMFDDRCGPHQLLSTQFFQSEEAARFGVSFLSQLLGLKLIEEKVKYLGPAIPQYEIGHRSQVFKLNQSLPPNLFAVGNYLEGIGMAAILKLARSVAKRCCSS